MNDENTSSGSFGEAPGNAADNQTNGPARSEESLIGDALKDLGMDEAGINALRSRIAEEIDDYAQPKPGWHTEMAADLANEFNLPVTAMPTVWRMVHEVARARRLYPYKEEENGR